MDKIMTAKHSGGLKECLETEQPITREVFEKLVFYRIYKKYCYDERIGATRYILVDMQNNPGLPTWINVYEKEHL